METERKRLHVPMDAPGIDAGAAAGGTTRAAAGGTTRAPAGVDTGAMLGTTTATTGRPAAAAGRIRLVALDIDGTLLGTNRVMSRRTRRALEAVRTAGVELVLATGRSYPEVAHIARRLKIDTPLICSNGAYICPPDGGEPYRTATIPHEINLEVTRAAKRRGETFYHYVGDTLILERQYVRKLRWGRFFRARSLERFHAAVNWVLEIGRWKIRVVDDALDYFMRSKEEPFTLMLNVGDDESRLHQIEEEFGTLVDVTAFGGSPLVVDLMPKGVNKATGLAYVGNGLGIGLDEILAIGDNYNDREMLAEMGFGVAMGNAPTPVKALADAVTLSNDQDGVAVALERYVLDNSAAGSL